MENLLSNKKLISAQQTSEILGISRATLTRIKDKIGFYRIGKQIKFRPENVANFLKTVENSAMEYAQLENKNGGIIND